MACKVIDWASQMHGGGCVSDDLPLAAVCAGARSLRFADGPDEMHREQIGKLELARVRRGSDAREIPRRVLQEQEIASRCAGLGS
jgi:alkylation response protein AidB-like acyl-CoA dehydrogenase